MSDKKNIDRVFQEKFKDFEPMPSDAVWDNIHDKLHNKKRKRRVIPIWWQLGGVAAILLLMLTVGGVFNGNDTDPTLPIVDNQTEKKDESNSKTTIDDANNNSNSTQLTNEDTSESNIDSFESMVDDTQVADNSSENNDKTNYTNNPQPNKLNNNSSIKKQNSLAQYNKEDQSSSKNTTNAIAKVDSQKENNENNSETKNAIKTNSELDALINASKKDDTAITETESNTKAQDSLNNTENAIKEDAAEELTAQKNAIEDAIAENKNEDDTTDEKEEDKFNRWSVSPNVAPVYFNTLGEGSSIHSQFNSNAKSGDINMSYGISGGYAVNKKLKVRAGVNRVTLGYSTDNVIAYSTLPTAANTTVAPQAFQPVNNQIENISFKNDTLNTSYLSAPIISLENAPEIIKTNPNTSLEQQFGFIEVPVELEYKVVDKKLGVNIIGGFSTMFLSDNEIYAVSEGNRTLIGEANNINEVSYSANFGVGLNYGVTEKLNINLEPMFKYQINTFNNTSGDFQPYFIGVYTGLSFKF
ncbi:hypothetical protein [Winogradskyella sp. 3972H.M.0a.05]|uniref:hypothetical protein n=1 Tax=Winogradskyella sp. 3972H.M.0a.05 TaxID=2950277 RepID=UPI0033981D52